MYPKTRFLFAEETGFAYRCIWINHTVQRPLTAVKSENLVENARDFLPLSQNIAYRFITSYKRKRASFLS